MADAIDALVAAGVVGVQSGDIKISARTAAPSGWLLCDGRLLSRTVFADLFAAIGVAYGAGDGSTTFAIPDYRNVFPMGAANAGSTGARGGEAAVALAPAHMPSHAHGGVTGGDSPDHAHYTSGNTGDDWPDHAHWHWSDMANQGNVRLWDGGGSFWTRGSAWNATAGATSRHTHAFGAWSGGASVRHAHGIAAEGGNAAHENRPPFAAVNFFIKT